MVFKYFTASSLAPPKYIRAPNILHHVPFPRAAQPSVTFKILRMCPVPDTIHECRPTLEKPRSAASGNSTQTPEHLYICRCALVGTNKFEVKNWLFNTNNINERRGIHLDQSAKKYVIE